MTMNHCTIPWRSSARVRSWSWRRVGALIGIVAAFIAGPLSWCVDIEAVAGTTISETLGIGDGGALNNRSASILHSCDEPVYLHQHAVVNAPPHLSTGLPADWATPIVLDCGVSRALLPAQTGPPHASNASFAPRGPPTIG